jgi:aminopeptidase N
VTVRDWLNLTAKEGLTTYREDAFMSDLDAAAAAVSAPYGSIDWEPELLSKLYSMTAAAAARGLPADAPRPSSWRRVWEGAYLRQEQFDEEEGPLAHPIRPRQVSSLCALYTDTVYAKVGEVGFR